MGIIQGARKVTAGSQMGHQKIARGLYDFATDGGAVSTITLRGDTIPSGAIVTDVFMQVNTALTSGGSATVAVGIETTSDVQSAAAYSGAPWSTTGAKRTTFVSTTAPITTTAARSITATVATAALTAGKFTVVVAYYEMESQT